MIPDYTVEWEMLVSIARFFKGALQIPDMLNMTFSEVCFYYKLEERAIVEENIINERQKGDKAIPIGKTLSRLVDKKIRENREEVKRINGQ